MKVGIHFWEFWVVEPTADLLSLPVAEGEPTTHSKDEGRIDARENGEQNALASEDDWDGSRAHNEVPKLIG